MPSKTIEVDFDRPRNGPVCFAAEAGDRIKLAWREQHNLHRLPSRNDYDSCAFGAAERPRAQADGHITARPLPMGMRWGSDEQRWTRGGHRWSWPWSRQRAMHISSRLPSGFAMYRSARESAVLPRNWADGAWNGRKTPDLDFHTPLPRFSSRPSLRVNITAATPSAHHH